MKAKAVKSMSFDEVVAKARKKQQEFEQLPVEEQERILREREEILEQLRGTPGFIELSI